MDEHLLLLRIATASEVLLDIRMFGFVSTSPSLAGWSGREGEGKRDLRCCFYHPPWQLLGWRLCWKDGYCCWLWLDLLAISRMLCSVAVSGFMLHTVPDLEGRPCGSDTRRAPAAAGKQDYCLNTAGHMYLLVCIAWLYTPLAADFGPGPETAAEGCSALAWSLIFYLPLSGLSK